MSYFSSTRVQHRPCARQRNPFAGLGPVTAALPRPSNVTVPGSIASAVKVTEAPTIDGVLDEGMWQGATPLGGFVQAEPLEGRPVREDRSALLYDDEAIYVGVTLHDSDPSQIVTTDTRRDAGLENRTRSR